MNTFRDIAEDARDRTYHGGGGCLSARDACIRAADRILEGFLTLQEAEEWATDMGYVFDAFGYQVSADAIRCAILVERRRLQEV